ncbi:MAG: hypothetical protein IPH97_00965 [Ignavibacteriales bacterium]|nr:hypothetical protein [Ignavibacteriales bacterium]
MKKFATLMLMVFALLFGCSPDANVTSPDDSAKPTAQLIKLPAMKSGLSIEALLTRSKYINGTYGGTFAETFEFQSVSGVVSIVSQLVFPANSFSGGKTIEQKFDTETASLEFGPAMQFNVPVLYTLTVSGLDLTGINPETLNFVYVAQDGSITGVVHEGITMNVATGTLKVTNAQLNHFSRYGFVN